MAAEGEALGSVGATSTPERQVQDVERVGDGHIALGDVRRDSEDPVLIAVRSWSSLKSIGDQRRPCALDGSTFAG